MLTAAVTLDTRGRQEDCRAVFDSLAQHGGLPASVDRLVLCNPGTPKINFATLVPVTVDYSDLPKHPDDPFEKLFVFLMPYDRVLYLDPCIRCTGDMSVLWSESFGHHILYEILLPDGSFDASMMLFNHNLLLGFHDTLVYLTRVRLLDGYGCTCCAMLNGYFQHTKRQVGVIPPGLARRCARS